MALSVGEQAIEPSGRISEGKLELQKLLKIFLDKDQKHFSVGEELSFSIFLLRKDERALQSLAEQRFLAEIKAVWVSSEGENWYDRCAPSLSEIAEEQARSNQGLEGEKVIKEYGMYALIPESMTSPTAVAARSGSRVRKQLSSHEKSKRNFAHISMPGVLKVP